MWFSSLLTFWLDDLFIGESWLLIYHCVGGLSVLLCLVVFVSWNWVCRCSVHICLQLLYLFVPFINMRCSSLSLLTNFSLKSALLYIGITIPAYFQALVAWKIFPSFHFKPVFAFVSEVHFLHIYIYIYTYIYI
jgi:hypothetical protein